MDAHSSSLWESNDPVAWRRALGGYDAVIAVLDVARLASLDRWYRDELPAAIAARTPRAVTLDELSRVTEWKMKRGTWRARNLALVRSNAEAEVARASAAAFVRVENDPPWSRRPLQSLCALDGVGPATASAVLAAAHPDLYPFFDEVVAAQIPSLGRLAFTLPYYARYAGALRAKAALVDDGLTANDLAQALFAAAGGKTPAA